VTPNPYVPAQPKAAPDVEDAQRADQSLHLYFACSDDAGPEAALWAINEALQAGKRAGKALLYGNVAETVASLDRAMRAMSAAGDSLQGLHR
jgi:hypothetical protein